MRQQDARNTCKSFAHGPGQALADGVKGEDSKLAQEHICFYLLGEFPGYGLKQLGIPGPCIHKNSSLQMKPSIFVGVR